jgi:hypothetical protein
MIGLDEKITGEDLLSFFIYIGVVFGKLVIWSKN